MPNPMSRNRVAWLAGGLFAGLAIAYFCPHEPTYATTADRDEQFEIVTVPVGAFVAGLNDPLDGVFVLDFLTGQLKGAVLNRQAGKFSSFYIRDLAKDFEVPGNVSGRYCMASGYGSMNAAGGIAYASGVLYVGEANSGKLIAYAFPWKDPGIGGPVELEPVDVLPWKKPAPKKKEK